MDLISRQDAIDALGESIYYEPNMDGKMKGFDLNDWKWHIANVLSALPSAQPVLTCDGCRHVGTYDTDFPCNGCVRREKDYYDPER